MLCSIHITHNIAKSSWPALLSHLIDCDSLNISTRQLKHTEGVLNCKIMWIEYSIAKNLKAKSRLRHINQLDIIFAWYGGFKVLDPFVRCRQWHRTYSIFESFKVTVAVLSCLLDCDSLDILARQLKHWTGKIRWRSTDLYIQQL